MWAYEHDLVCDAPVDALWRLYSDVGTWPSWNGAVEHVRLDGPFVEGAVGELTPVGQDPLPVRITAVDKGSGYTSETVIADTVTLRTTNEAVQLLDGRTAIRHRVELVGPAAEYFGQSFGPTMAAGVPRTAEALAARAAELSSLHAAPAR